MSEAWFNPNLLGGILGAAFGCSTGIWGSLAGLFAARGKARFLVLGLGWSLLGCSFLCLALAAVALAVGQPRGVWYGFGLVGVLGSIILPTGLFTVHRAYAQCEARRMQAEDLL